MSKPSSERFRHERHLGFLFCLWLAIGQPASAQNLRAIFKEVNPSVVVIHTKETSAALSDLTPSTLANGLPGLAMPKQSIGSGVLISESGQVLTAAHVIRNAEQIEVEFLGGERVLATVLAVASVADLALLQLERVPVKARVAPIGDSGELEVGDQVFAIGAPFGATHSLAVGWVSARRTSEEILESLAPLETLQVDIALYQGNSGGPVFNLSGQVVGIVTHVLTQENQITGPGFAVTSNIARRLMLEEKQVWLGLETWLLEDELAVAFNVPQSAGLLVQSVAPQSLAARLGIVAGKLVVQFGEQPMRIGGDVVLEISGLPIRPTHGGMLEIQHRLKSLPSGAALHAKVLRAGKVMEVSTTIP